MDSEFLLLMLAGFLAQLVDGALGMGFGIVGTTLMLALGHSPAAASAMVHIAEVFTTGASGISHLVQRNIDWSYVRGLAVAGVIGGALGAYVLTSVDGNLIRPLILAYLGVMGLVIVAKALRGAPPTQPEDKGAHHLLGFFGGFFDAAGGGGWGPIVTSTLVGRGHAPRYVVGSVNLTEFFVTLTISATFIASLGLEDLRPVLGFLLGGLIAAPLAGLLTRVVPLQAMRIGVGLLVLMLTAFQTWRLVAG